ncbi:MAG: thermonuclease family protein [Deltaproteobacteria bacterium]|nr:thermonuclease family protein [Deltaproteobacteria bacterium]
MRVLCAAAMGVLLACGCSPGGERCGPQRAVVSRVIDGDTADLEDGTRVRYLMIDTPEITGGKQDCYGQEAKDYNISLVEGKEVELAYDVECSDPYGRLLAYVSVSGQEVNSRMVERGYACVLYIPPNGEDRRQDFETLEFQARSEGRGMWGACEEVSCD